MYVYPESRIINCQKSWVKNSNSHTFVSSQSCQYYNTIWDRTLRQAGFCRPSIHQVKLVKEGIWRSAQQRDLANWKNRSTRVSRGRTIWPQMPGQTKRAPKPAADEAAGRATQGTTRLPNHRAPGSPSNNARCEKGPSQKEGKTHKEHHLHPPISKKS